MAYSTSWGPGFESLTPAGARLCPLINIHEALAPSRHNRKTVDFNI